MIRRIVLTLTLLAAFAATPVVHAQSKPGQPPPKCQMGPDQNIPCCAWDDPNGCGIYNDRLALNLFAIAPLQLRLEGVEEGV